VTCNRVSVSRPRSTLALALPPSPYLLLCVPESTFLFLLSHLFFSTIMARSQSLLTPQPTNIVRQPVTICHVCVFFNLQTHCALSHIYIFYPRQLRDLIICPDERGVVNYVQDQCIMERDMTDPSSVSPFPFHLIFLSPPFFISFYFLLCLCVPMRATKKVRKGKEQTDSLGLKGNARVAGFTCISQSNYDTIPYLWLPRSRYLSLMLMLIFRTLPPPYCQPMRSLVLISSSC
jgi:hypothetical protein